MRFSLKCSNEMQKLNPYNSMSYIPHERGERGLPEIFLLLSTSAGDVNKVQSGATKWGGNWQENRHIRVRLTRHACGGSHHERFPP